MPDELVRKGLGRIFTPSVWAEWLLDRFGVLDAWLRGASVCDPTAGQGSFPLALFSMARKKGIEVTCDMLRRITLMEVDEEDLRSFAAIAQAEFSVVLPSSNLQARDVLLDTPDQKFDIIVGNPPWANYTDLPPEYRNRIKPLFLSTGLVPDTRRALLGSSRVDIAALVIRVVMGCMTNSDGRGVFFLPASLFTGGDAHRGFRSFESRGRKMAVKRVFRFTATRIFKQVHTAYVAAEIQMDRTNTFPVDYMVQEGEKWSKRYAFPLEQPDDQWRVVDHKDGETSLDDIRINIQQWQKPRQGINTCGANSVFIFNSRPRELPDEYIFPLATGKLWEGGTDPEKWILLPYSSDTARPLSPLEIKREKALWNYLNEYREKLQNRRGKFIRSMIEKGIWWALLGVGPYSFTPCKVIWQAYGTSEFKPLVLKDFHGRLWQPNQAMHAFIPCRNMDDARRIADSLADSGIESLLREMDGDGKRNWAQPGKMRKIFSM